MTGKADPFVVSAPTACLYHMWPVVIEKGGAAHTYGAVFFHSFNQAGKGIRLNNSIIVQQPDMRGIRTRQSIF